MPQVMTGVGDIRIHQYLDDWLLRAPCPETCQRHTQTLESGQPPIGALQKCHMHSMTYIHYIQL